MKASDHAVGRKMYCPACYFELIVPAESTVKSKNETAVHAENNTYEVDAVPIDVREMQHRHVASFPCPVCRAMLAAEPTMVGKEIECPDCGTNVVVPIEIVKVPDTHQTARRAIPPSLPSHVPSVGVYGVQDDSVPSDPALSRKSFPVWCRLCGTIMYATEDQIGAMLVCPDCNTRTIARKMAEKYDSGPHQAQRFEGGSTYEIADASYSPGTRLVPVVCELCATRMYAAESEIGQKKVCPDCGRETLIADVPEKEKIVYEVPGGAYGVSDQSQFDRPSVRAGVDYRYVDGSLDREHWNPDGGKPVPVFDHSSSAAAALEAIRGAAGELNRISPAGTPQIPENYSREARVRQIREETLRERPAHGAASEKHTEKHGEKRALPSRTDTRKPGPEKTAETETVSPEKKIVSIKASSPLPVSHRTPPAPPLPAAPVSNESFLPGPPVAAETRSTPSDGMLPRDDYDQPMNRRKRTLTRAERVLVRKGRKLLPRFPLVSGLLKPFCDFRIVAHLSGMLVTALFSGFLWIGAMQTLMIGGVYLVYFFIFTALQLVCTSVWGGMLASYAMSLFTASAGGDDEWGETAEYDYVSGVGLAAWIISLSLTATIPGFLTVPAAPLLVPGTVDQFDQGGPYVSMKEMDGMPLDHPLVIAYLAMRLSHWLIFPILFLGCMESGSFFNPISFNVFRSLAATPLRWGTFYLLSFFVLLLPEVLAWPTGFVQHSPILFGVAASFLVALFAMIVLLYFRLLGRHAWALMIAEEMRRAEDEDD
ncbi:MAG TPA: hypothetical protein DEB39_05720 [Planctomycetaceae bacterium]|nr:hypothetical protein [Planctomycetaceae bacterium]